MCSCGTNTVLRKVSAWNRGEPPQDFPKTDTLRRGETFPALRKTSEFNRGELPKDFPKTATLKRGEPFPALRKTSEFNRGELPKDFPKTATLKRGEPFPALRKTSEFNRGELPKDFPKTATLKRGETLPVLRKTSEWNRGEPPQDFPKTGTLKRGEGPSVLSRVSAWNQNEPPQVFPKRAAPKLSTADPKIFGEANVILALDTCNFDDFIALKEKALIMFYNPCAPDTICPAKQFTTASNRPHPENHAFASVDCRSEQELCCREKATQLPIFKVYSNGFEASTIKVAKNFTADQMNMLIKMTPVLTKPKTIISRV